MTTPPAPGPHSYGTPAGVVGYSRAWTHDGAFLDPISVAASTISFDNAGHISDSALGLGGFVAGTSILVRGSAHNDGTYTILTVSDATLIVAETTATEAAGNLIALAMTTNATSPTLTTVVQWIDQLSAALNAALGAYGFTVPITQADAKEACTTIVEQLVADLVQAANNTGRFFSDKALAAGVTPQVAVQQSLYSWAKTYASGLEQLGAARNVPANEYRVGFRDSGPLGQPIFPIFQRDGFGNHFQDWESEQNTNPWPDVNPDPNG